MAKTDNLQDFLTDVANAIRTKTGTTQPINAQNFSTEILNIQTGGGGNTLKNLLDATKSAYYLFYDYKGTSVDGLIAYDDTENVTTVASMFDHNTNLINAPLLNTSNATWWVGAFSYCNSLINLPLYDMSKATDISNLFKNCEKLTQIPLFVTNNVKKMRNTFAFCIELTTIPLLNTEKVLDMSYCFNGCVKLASIPELNVSNVESFTECFSNCTSLKSILMTGMKVSFNISASTKFEESDLVTILNNLATVTTTKTLTMGATNLAKLTDEEKAIATGKGWTLA